MKAFSHLGLVFLEQKWTEESYGVHSDRCHIENPKEARYQDALALLD